MRGLIYLKNLWQPIAVIGGAILAITGITATVWEWVGVWPAASVGGTLTSYAALRWGRLAVIEESVE